MEKGALRAPFVMIACRKRAVSGFPAEEVGEDPQARRLAFLGGVELRAHHIVASDQRCDGPCVIDMGEALRRVGHGHVVGMDEIGVIAGFDPRRAPDAGCR